MHQITESSDREFGKFTSRLEGAQPLFSSQFRVHPHRRTEFFELICGHSDARDFLEGYAPVQFLATPHARMTNDSMQVPTSATGHEEEAQATAKGHEEAQATATSQEDFHVKMRVWVKEF